MFTLGHYMEASSSLRHGVFWLVTITNEEWSQRQIPQDVLIRRKCRKGDNSIANHAKQWNQNEWIGKIVGGVETRCQEPIAITRTLGYGLWQPYIILYMIYDV